MHPHPLGITRVSVLVALVSLVAIAQVPGPFPVPVVVSPSVPVVVSPPVTVGNTPPVAVGVTPSVTISGSVPSVAGWSSLAPSFTANRAQLPAHPARLANLSIRALAGGSATPLVAGAVVQGTGNLPLLVRAIGPGLRQFGVANPLPDPALELFRGTVSAARTNNFDASTTAAAAYVGAFPLTAATSATSGDTALLGQSATGTLTAYCTSPSNASGAALLEFYDATASAAPATARFTNFSSRARVEGSSGWIVIGFVIDGDGELPLLLRGVGATLGAFNLPGTLSDPVIELFSGANRIAVNDNWRSGGAAAATALQDAGRALGAFDLASDNDAALLVRLPAGLYTLLIHGAAGQSGVALGEIYEATGANAGFEASRAINSVGLDIYRSVAADQPGRNFAVSPYSLETALAMTYVGAAGDTRAEMARVLRLPDDNDSVQSGLAALRTSLTTIAQQSATLAQERTTPTLRVDPIEWAEANRLFGQFDYGFRDSFLNYINDGFGAPLQPLDFVRAYEPARQTINDWVAAQTRQKILNLIPRDGITDSTRLVLVNALYLKAAWDVPFKENDTAPRAFFPAPDTSRSVPTMYRAGFMGYAAEEGMQVVTLDYLGGGLQFVIVLPDQGQTPEAAAARLTPAHFARWSQLSTSSPRQVTLYLPKFRIEGATIALGDAFQALGMKTAFDLPPHSANFDGMAPRRPEDYLFISEIYHRTFVLVQETGTEAAAATAVVIAVPASAVVYRDPPVVVRVDRPFLFAIQHKATGACLFIGRVNDP